MKKYARLLGSCPHLQQNVENGQLFLYDTAGYARELTEDHRIKVEKLKKEYKVEVLAILQTNTDFGFMESYLIVDDEDEFLEDGYVDNSTAILAYVVSPICEEMGSIGIKEACGRLKRVW